MHGGEAKKRMLDIVAGQNRDRAFRRQVAIEQRRGNRAYGCKHRGVSQRPPRARVVALREEDALRRNVGPMGKPFGEVIWIGSKKPRRAHHDDAVGSAFNENVRTAEVDRPQRRPSWSWILLGSRPGHHTSYAFYGAVFQGEFVPTDAYPPDITAERRQVGR